MVYNWSYVNLSSSLYSDSLTMYRNMLHSFAFRYFGDFVHWFGFFDIKCGYVEHIKILLVVHIIFWVSQVGVLSLFYHFELAYNVLVHAVACRIIGVILESFGRCIDMLWCLTHFIFTCTFSLIFFSKVDYFDPTH